MLSFNYFFWDGWGVAPTFMYSPTFAPTWHRQPRVLSIRFGDGYEQRSADGINADLRRGSVPFTNITRSEADAIESFFTTYNTAVRPFFWTPWDSTAPKKFLCRSWDRTRQSPTLDSITAMFEEVPDP